MYNDLFTIGNITVHGYGLMIGIGIIAAYLMTEHLAKKQAMDPDPVFSLLIFGGILAGYAVCRIKKISFWDYLDCATPSIALAQGFGRIGCFLAGCCYGMETDSWCAITFTNSQFAPNHVPLVPTQIFSSVFDFAHFVLLYVITRRSKVPGFTSSLYLIIYGVGRFVIEFFRGDLIRGSVGALSTSQFISIFIVAFGVVLMVKKLRDSKRDQIAQENTRDEEEKVENVKENH